MGMKRIVVIGPAGSGKTTLAFNIASKLKLPVTELDDLHWQPGWQITPRDEFKKAVRNISEGDAWVVAGNYQGIRNILWNKADTVVWLDHDFGTNLWRLCKRTVQRLFDQRPICNGNRESLSNIFSKNSLIPWFLRTYLPRKREYDGIFNDKDAFPHLTKVRLKSQKDADAFLRYVEHTSPALD